MRRHIDRLFSTIIVWLTVCCTLLASSPHFECACPDNTRTSRCLSWFAGPFANSDYSEDDGAGSVVMDGATGGCCHGKSTQVSVHAGKLSAFSKDHSGLPAISEPVCAKTIAHSVAMFPDQRA